MSSLPIVQIQSTGNSTYGTVPDLEMQEDPESEEEVMLKQEDGFGSGDSLPVGWPPHQEPVPFDDMIF